MNKINANRLYPSDLDKAIKLAQHIKIFWDDVEYFDISNPDNPKISADCSNGIFNHDIEDLVYILPFIKQYLDGKGLGPKISTMSEILYPATYDGFTELFIRGALISIEGYIQTLYYFVYNGVTVETPNGTMECYNGFEGGTKNKVDRIAGLIDTTLGRLVQNRVTSTRNTWVTLPEVGGKVGFFDRNTKKDKRNSIINNIIDTTVANRNKTAAHVAGSTNVGATPAEKRFSNVGGKNSVVIYQRILITILLTIDSRYDEIYEKVYHQEEEATLQTAVSEEEKLGKISSYIRDRYLDEIIGSQLNIIKKIYKRSIDIESIDLQRDIIDINLVKIQDIDEDDDEDIHDEESIQLRSFELLDNIDNLTLIGGSSGTGKSVMLSTLITKCANDYLNSTSKLIPIKFDLMGYNDPSIGLITHIENSFTTLRIHSDAGDDKEALKEYLSTALNEGRVIIFLDGVNEIKSDITQRVIDNIIQFTDKYKRCRFVVSSRLAEIERVIDMFGDFDKYVLQPLSDKQIREHLRRISIFENQSEDSDKLWEAVNNDDNLLTFARNPMHLSMLSNLLKDVNRENIAGINRGGLYNRFINKLIEINSEDGYTKTNEMLLNTLLNFMAKSIWENSERRTIPRMNLIQAVIEDVLFNGSERMLEKALSTAINFGLLVEDNDIIKFTHDSFMEYFEALYLVTEFSSREDQSTLLSDMTNHSLESDLLRMMVEIMETNKDKTLAGRFVRLMLQRDKDAEQNSATQASLEWNEEGYFNLSQSSSESLGISKYLPLLAEISNTLKNSSGTLIPLTSEPKISTINKMQAKDYIELYILNHLYLYKRLNPDGKIDYTHIFNLLKCAALCGSKRLIEEIFTPYWMQMWAIHDNDYRNIMKISFNDDLPSDRSTFIQKKNLAYSLASSCSNPKLLALQIIDAIAWMSKLGFGRSILYTKRHILYLFSQIDDRKRVAIYNSISSREDMAIYASSLLLLMDDTEFIKSKFTAETPVEWSDYLVQKLLLKSEQPVIMDIILSNYKQLSKDAASITISHYLHRNSYPQQLMDIIWKHHSQNRNILDLIPLSLIPQSITNRIYNQNVYQYLIDEDKSSIESISYRIASYNEEKIWVTIHDYNIDLKDLKAEVYDTESGETQLFDIVNEKYIYEFPTKINIAHNQMYTTLPKHGYITGLNQKGEEEAIGYVAATNSVSSITTYTLDSHQKQLFAYWLEQKQTVKINEAICSITNITDTTNTRQYLRVIELVRNDNSVVPNYEGSMRIININKPNSAVQINRAIRTKFNYRDNLFIDATAKSNSADNSAIQMPYSIYGYNSKSAVIWSESSNESLSDRICQLSNSPTNWQIIADSTFNTHYAEITLSSPSHIKIAPSGTIYRTSESEDEIRQIPYIYSIINGSNYTLRIDDEECVKSLQEKGYVSHLKREKYLRIGKVRFKLIAINIYKHNPKSSKITISPMDSVSLSEIPQSGTLTIKSDNKKAANTKQHPITIDNLRYIGADENKSWFVANENHHDINNLYIKFEELMPYGSVVSNEVITEYSQAVITLESNIPLSGVCQFDSAPNTIFRYWSETKNVVDNRYTLNIISTSNGEEASDMSTVINSAKLFITDGASVQIESATINKTASSDIKSCICVDTIYDIALRRKFKSAALKIYCPIVNKIKSTTSNNYKVSSVSYHKLSSDNTLITIPRCLLSVNGLYFKLNKHFMIYRAEEVELDQSTDEVRSNIELRALRIPDNPAIKNEGEITFYIDASASTPANISYDMLSYIVDYSNPHQYHSSICDILLEEAKQNMQASIYLIHFFTKRNKSADLLNYFLTLPEEKYKEIEALKVKFKVCIVSKVTSLGYQLHSPLYFDTNIEGSELYSSRDISTQYRTGDLVVLEENGQLHSLDVSKLKDFHYASLGFREGVVISILESGSGVHIRNSDNDNAIFNKERKDFFYYCKDAEQMPKLGDVARFFPTINIRIPRSGEIIATKVKILRSTQTEGTVTEITKVAEGITIQLTIMVNGEEFSLPAFINDKVALDFKDVVNNIKVGDNLLCYTDSTKTGPTRCYINL